MEVELSFCSFSRQDAWRTSDVVLVRWLESYFIVIRDGIPGIIDGFCCFVRPPLCLEVAEHWLKGMMQALTFVLFELAGMRYERAIL